MQTRGHAGLQLRNIHGCSVKESKTYCMSRELHVLSTYNVQASAGHSHKSVSRHPYQREFLQARSTLLNVAAALQPDNSSCEAQ